MSGARYPIGTLREMASIPAEALPRFLAELPLILEEAKRAYAAQDAVNAALAGVAKMSDDGSPEWVDDDLNEVNISVRSGDEVVSGCIKRGA